MVSRPTNAASQKAMVMSGATAWALAAVAVASGLMQAPTLSRYVGLGSLAV